jgi:hypothetical protein
MRKGQFRSAPRVKTLTGLDAILHLNPAFGKPLKAALDAHDRGDIMESMRQFNTCAMIDPTNKALLHYGAMPLERAYFGLRRAETPPPPEELARWREVVYTVMIAATEAFPDDSVMVHNVGKFLQDEGDDEGSIPWYRRALSLKHDRVETWGNLGTALYTLGHADEAELCWSKCVAFPATDASGTMTQAFVWLRRGDYIRGWPALNARWNDRTFGLTYGRRDLHGKPWTGQPLKKGESVLVHGEQGHGDHVQFARYIPIMQARGIKVAGLETRGPLLRWFRECLTVPVVCRDTDPLPKYTHHVPLMSLPGLLKQYDAPVPLAPTVTPRRLEPAITDRKRIGVVWQGTAGNSVDHVRSLPAEMLGELAGIPGVTWVPLQFDPSGTADMTARAWLGDVQTTDGYKDVLELGELMLGLDAVVSVDTLAAHVAGSLGVPTYILHRFNREWRWGSHRETTEWYPSAVSLTQPAPGDWKGLLVQLRERLLRHEQPAAAPLVLTAARGEVVAGEPATL